MNFLDAYVTRSTAEIEVDVCGLGLCTVDAEQALVGVAVGLTKVGIRPETPAILFEGATTPLETIRGVVAEVVYYGDMSYYDIQIDGVKIPLNIAMKNLIGRPVLAVGDATAVVWDAGSLVLLP